MKHRLLGRTGLYVSEIALGSMTFGGRGNWNVIGTLGLDHAVEQLKVFLDAGGNFLDTADMYSEGQTETLLGAALRKLGISPDDLVVATKVRHRVQPGINAAGLSRDYILRAVDASLRRMDLDHIDVYYLHGVDKLTPLEETLRAMEDLVRSGRVRYIGLSNFPAYKIAQALGIADRRGWDRAVAAQMYYSAVGRDIEHEVVPLLAEEQVGLVAWSPLAGGFLSGKYHSGKSEHAGRRSSFDFPPISDLPLAHVTVEVLRSIAAQHSATIAQVALAWVLAQSTVASVIVGASTVAQLQENLAAPAVKLEAEEIDRISRAYPRADQYPRWQLEFQHRDRLPDALPILRQAASDSAPRPNPEQA